MEVSVNRRIEKLNVMVFDSAEAMGRQAACAIAEDMRSIARKGRNIRIMFAAAPSQNTTLEALLGIESLPWERVTAFHMDEYVGLAENDPKSFRNFLSNKIFDKLPLAAVHLIKGESKSPQDEADAYAALLREEQLDIVIMGIGENGHIAFNDPPDTSFTDPLDAKLIFLSEESRRQQVHDGCFARIEDVPREAITVTIPGIIRASSLHCVVPGHLKEKAVRNALFGPVNAACPASVLRTHPQARLYLDKFSGLSLLEGN